MTLQIGRGAPAAPAATLDSAGAPPCFPALENLKVYFHILNYFLFSFLHLNLKIEEFYAVSSAQR